MRLSFSTLSRSTAPLLLLLALGLRATATPPEAANAAWLLGQRPLLCVQIDDPKAAVQRLLHYFQMPELQPFPAYREFLDSTGRKRGLQLLAYLEKQLGCGWEEILDRVAGQGVSFTLETGFGNPFSKPQPTSTLVLNGKDAAFTQKLADLLLELGTQELARADRKREYTYETFQGVRIAILESEFAAAVVGPRIVLSNKLPAVKAAISRSKTPRPVPAALVKARQNLGEPPLAWLWADLKQAKGFADKDFRDLVQLPTNNFIPHVIVGGWLDVIRRADEMTVALRTEGDDLLLTATLPAGQEGMSEVMRTVFAKPANGPALPALSTGPDTLFHASFHYHPHGFLRHLDGYVTEQLRKDFAEFDKNSRLVLLGRSFSQLVELIGHRHQFIAARQRDTGYQTQPRSPQPAFAVVMEVTDGAKFDQQAVPLIRAAGFLGTLNIPMKLFEEKHGEHALLGYRFVENEANQARDHGLLFNFSPSMVRVGNQVILSSTRELALDLLPAVKSGQALSGSWDQASSRYRFSWVGLGQFLDAVKGQVLSQIVLQDGCSHADAERQYEALKKLFARLGTIDAAVFYEPRQFRIELRTRLAAK